MSGSSASSKISSAVSKVRHRSRCRAPRLPGLRRFLASRAACGLGFIRFFLSLPPSLIALLHEGLYGCTGGRVSPAVVAPHNGHGQARMRPHIEPTSPTAARAAGRAVEQPPDEPII